MEKNLIMILVKMENTFDKVQHQFMIKTLSTKNSRKIS